MHQALPNSHTGLNGVLRDNCAVTLHINILQGTQSGQTNGSDLSSLQLTTCTFLVSVVSVLSVVCFCTPVLDSQSCSTIHHIVPRYIKLFWSSHTTFGETCLIPKSFLTVSQYIFMSPTVQLIVC